MTRTMKGLAAALTIGSTLALAAPAEARDGWRDGWHGSREWRSDRGWHGNRHWRGDGYRDWRGDRWGYGGYYRYAPRYGYGYGYDYPRYRYYRHDDDGALIAGIAGLAIGAAIASGD